MQFIADLGGAVVVLLYIFSKTIAFFKDVPVLFKEHTLLFFVSVFLLLLTLLFLLKSIKYNWSSISILWKRKRIEGLLSNKETEIVSSDLNLDKYIPSESSVSLICETAQQEGLDWSRDANLESFNMYIEKDGSEIKLRFQLFITSDWKNETLTLYYPHLSKDYQRKSVFARIIDQKHFFEIVGWRDAIIASYTKISGTLPNSFKIQVCGENSLGEGLTINFMYKRGLVDERHGFTFTDGILTSELDGTSVAL